MQVNKSNYVFSKYCNIERWSSYWQQINEVLKIAPKNLLEIGVGDKVLAAYLKNNTGIEYKSMDIAEDLKPDYSGSIEKMPLAENTFDLVCAFEVLEHLPKDNFLKALQEMQRVSKKYVIISLPHWGRHFSLEIKLPLLKRIKLQYKFNLFSPKHVFNGQHYWEIGKKGSSLKNIKNIIKESKMKIIKDFVVFESPYHHFFILEK